MHNIVLSEQYGMPDSLNYESTHIQMSYILYFCTISKLPTLKDQCVLEDLIYQTFTRHKPAPCFKQNSLRMYTDMQYLQTLPITKLLCLTQVQCLKTHSQVIY